MEKTDMNEDVCPTKNGYFFNCYVSFQGDVYVTVDGSEIRLTTWEGAKTLSIMG